MYYYLLIFVHVLSYIPISASRFLGKFVGIILFRVPIRIKRIAYSWFELMMLAYNLMNFFKEEVLNQKKVKHMTRVIRDRIFFIPGKLVFTSRKCVLKLERKWPYRTEYEEAVAKF